MDASIITLNEIQYINSYTIMKDIIKSLNSGAKILSPDIQFGSWCIQLNVTGGAYYKLICGAAHYFKCRDNEDFRSSASQYHSYNEACEAFSAIIDWESYEKCVVNMVCSHN